MKRVGIIANPLKEGVDEAVGMVAKWCDRHGLGLLAGDTVCDLIPDAIECAPPKEVVGSVDLVFAFGGDGTLLYAARTIAEEQRATPIIGVNMGSLGFLTQIAQEEFPEVLRTLDLLSLPVTERMMLSVEVGAGGSRMVALNDVVIAKGADSKMLSFEATVDGELVTRYAADGLILATPTGSTAHSISAGGPVVMPSVEAIIATPICPHTLGMRPLVVPPTTVIVVEMLSCDDETVVTTDGHKAFDIRAGDRVLVRKASATARLVDVSGHSYYEILRRKMRWAGGVRER
jgi:NAD+ kinase